MRPGVFLGILGYPGVSWGNQTDPVRQTERESSNLSERIYIK